MAKYHVILSKTAPSQRDALWLKPVSRGIVLYALNNGEWQPLKTVDDKDTSNPGDDEVVTVAALKQAIAEVQAYAEQQSTEDKAALEKLKQRLNTLIGADEEGESIDVTAAIDTFNEIKEFLEGIEDTTLGALLSRLEELIDAKAVQGDWSTNDPSDPSYIKNRTHYEETSERTLYTGTTTPVYKQGDSMTWYDITLNSPMEIGENIEMTVIPRGGSATVFKGTVVEDGKVTLYAPWSPGPIASLMNDTITTFATYNLYIQGRTISQDVTLDIQASSTTVHTIDDKYIPSTVARTGELRSGVFYNSNTSGLTNGDGDRINNIAFEYGSGVLTNLSVIASTGQNIYFQNAGITGVTGIDFEMNTHNRINYLSNLNMRYGTITGVTGIYMASGNISIGGGTINMAGGGITGVSQINFSNGNVFTGVASIPSTLNNIQKINMSSGEISGVIKLSTGNKSLDLANGTLNGVDTINTSGNTLKIGTTSEGSYHAIEFGTPASLYTGWKPKIMVVASGSGDYLEVYGIQQNGHNLQIRKSDFTVTAYSPVTGSSGYATMTFACGGDNTFGTLTVPNVRLNGGSLSMNGGQINFSGNGQIYPYYVTGGGGYYAGINISNLRGVTFADGATISGTVSGIVNTSNLALSGGTFNSPSINSGTITNASISGVNFSSGNTYEAGYIDELKAALGLQ